MQNAVPHHTGHAATINGQILHRLVAGHDRLEDSASSNRHGYTQTEGPAAHVNAEGLAQAPKFNLHGRNGKTL